MSLRHVNALFAERVLGQTDWYLSDRSKGGYASKMNPYQSLPDYTSSLDATWAGVEKVNLPVAVEYWPSGATCFRITKGGAQVGFEMELEPAEALVKALLLAVGVTQAEIDAAVAA